MGIRGETGEQVVKPVIGSKFGCLEIMDEGEAFPEWIDAKIAEVINEKEGFMELVREGRLQRQDWCSRNGDVTIPKYCFVYTPVSFPTYSGSVDDTVFDREVAQLEEQKKTVHYRCRCRKCNKTRFYTFDTLQSNPNYCFSPIYCSTKHSYSIKARNANYLKCRKYGKNEAVRLVSERNEVVPSEEYCCKWNEKREKELRRAAEKEAAIIEKLPRKMAKNYDQDYVGTCYESLKVIKCVNDHLESVPVPRFNQRHQKSYGTITVYKQYLCQCYLCNREQLVCCDRFGINPPTEYGDTAYFGYWSNLKCDCHLISSFQWKVNRILIENRVPYQVEVSFPDLKQGKLRFDFAIFSDDGSLKCLIECQGEQHYKPLEEFGGKRQYSIQRENDDTKREYVKLHNIPYIEISFKDKKYEKLEEILREHEIIG